MCDWRHIGALLQIVTVRRLSSLGRMGGLSARRRELENTR
jgi:hypothetical protein